MPRQKRGGRRGNFSTPSRGKKHGLESSFVPFSGTSASQKNHNGKLQSTPAPTSKQSKSNLTMHSGFTLQQEAMNTGRNSSFWNTDQRLRDTKVSFVSAGTLDKKETKDEADSNNAALAEMSLSSNPLEAQDEGGASGDSNMEDTAIASIPAVDVLSSESFVIDTSGSQAVATGLPPPQLRPVSPTPSNSSEEIILFRGKGRPPRVVSEQSGATKIESAHINSIDTRIKIIDDEIHER
jgi:hypothetical protein